MRRASLLLLVAVMAGCCPLYVPLDPGAEPPAPRTALVAEAVADAARPVLRVEVVSVPQEGWLAVQWFGPDNREAASESIWLEPGSAGMAYTLALPEDAGATPGSWRALLSMNRVVLRQVSFTVR